MQTQRPTTGELFSALPSHRHGLPKRLLARLLFAAWGLFLLTEAAYAGYVTVKGWPIEQD